jgi:hypothetical protein
VSQSLQAKDRDHQISCSPSQGLHPACEKGERGVQVLDPKGLVDKYLGTQNLDTTQYTQLIMRVSKMQNLVRK